MVKFEFILNPSDVDVHLPLDTGLESVSEGRLLSHLKEIDSQLSIGIDSLVSGTHFQWIVSVLRLHQKKEEGYSLGLLEKIGETIQWVLD